MTRWKLPDGVGYPVQIDIISALVDGSFLSMRCRYDANDDYDLRDIIRGEYLLSATSIRLNNQIDLVKIEE